MIMMTLYSIADNNHILDGFGVWRSFTDAMDVLKLLKRHVDPLSEFCVKAIDSLTGLEVKQEQLT